MRNSRTCRTRAEVRQSAPPNVDAIRACAAAAVAAIPTDANASAAASCLRRGSARSSIIRSPVKTRVEGFLSAPTRSTLLHACPGASNPCTPTTTKDKMSAQGIGLRRGYHADSMVRPPQRSHVCAGVFCLQHLRRGPSTTHQETVRCRRRGQCLRQCLRNCQRGGLVPASTAWCSRRVSGPWPWVM